MSTHQKRSSLERKSRTWEEKPDNEIGGIEILDMSGNRDNNNNKSKQKAPKSLVNFKEYMDMEDKDIVGKINI